MNKKNIIFLILVIILFMFTSKQIIKTFSASEQKIISEKGYVNVYFCPKDRCDLVLEKFIDSAEEYAHCALFDLRLKNVIKALGEQSKEVNVRVVVDNDYYGPIKGAGVRMDDSRQFTHNKFCVMDDKYVLTGSFNPTERGAFKNNNNVLVIKSKYLAENYKEEFNELWNSNFGNGLEVRYPVVYINDIEIENYFCPEDKCRERVIEEIQKANSSIYFMTFTFTDEEIADAILFKDIKDIKGIFEKRQAGSEYSQYKRLKEFGLNVKLDKNSYTMHHKVFIIDNKTVITGSYNPTGAGNYKNDENMLIIHNKKIAKEFVEEFNSLW